jgi:hypothetical protein
MVDHVQAIYLDPFDVSLGTIYNRSLLDEINANWDLAPLANTASPPGTVPTEPDGVLFYDAQDTVQVKDMPTDWQLPYPSAIRHSYLPRSLAGYTI